MKEYQELYSKEENSEAFYLYMENLAFNDLEHSYLKQSVFYSTHHLSKHCTVMGSADAQELVGTCNCCRYCAASSCLLKV